MRATPGSRCRYRIPPTSICCGRWASTAGPMPSTSRWIVELHDEDWLVPSLSSGWDVHDVLAHLVDTPRTGRLSFVRDLLMARLDFDRANEIGIAREGQHDPQRTVNAIKGVVHLTRTPPAYRATRLVDHRPSAAHPGLLRRRTRARSGSATDRPGKTGVAWGRATTSSPMPSICGPLCPDARWTGAH